MDPKPEIHKSEKGKITWEVVDDGRLLELIKHTLMETVYQKASATDTALALAKAGSPERKEGVLNLARQATADTVRYLQAIQTVLGQDRKKNPIPIDHRYEQSTGALIIALDLIKPPTLERKNPL